MKNDMQRVTAGTGNADFPGNTHAALQAAVDHVSGLGGGTVEVLPGTYAMGNALHLRHHVRLVGHGEDTRLVKSACHSTPLKDDIDWYMWSAEVEDPSGFEVGGGLLLTSRDPHGGVPNVTKHTVTAIDGCRLHLDTQPRKNHWITHEARAATLFPVLTGNWVDDIAVENILIDGNRAENEPLDGNYGGCIFLQDCNRVTMRNVTACNNNGDGMSWQICNDVTVENCRSTDHAGLAMHPGSGSQRSVIRDNTMANCHTGLFWCWGVRHGLAEDNEIRNCIGYGISIGHRDTDNVMKGNRVFNSGQAGLIFRQDSDAPPYRAAHRNRVESNHFEGGGTEEQSAVGIDIQAPVEDVVLRDNRFVNPPASHINIGIRVGAEVTRLTIEGNTFDNIDCEISRTDPVDGH